MRARVRCIHQSSWSTRATCGPAPNNHKRANAKSCPLASLPPRAPSTATHSSDWQWAAPTFKNYGGSQSFSGQKTTKCREEKSMHLMNDMIQGLNKHRCAPLRRADGRMDGRRKRNGTEERLRPADGRAECPSFLVPHTRTRDDGPCERIASASVR